MPLAGLSDTRPRFLVENRVASRIVEQTQPYQAQRVMSVRAGDARVM
jgi:hypothetical protein